MFGGFDYNPLAAGIQETFRFARRIEPDTAVQMVTLERGTPYADIHKGSVIRTWNDAMALTTERSGGTHNERIQSYIESMTDHSGAERLLSRFKEVFDSGYYGLMHIWLRENDAQEDEFIELWHAYRLPALLPFGLALSSPGTALADLRERIQRLSTD